MPTYPDFNNVHVAQFKNTIDLLSQQMEPRIAGNTASMTCIGDQAQSVVMLNAQEPTELTAPTYNGSAYNGWYGDTVWDSAEHTQRWVMPTVFKRALPISDKDMQRMLEDPKSRYAEAIVAGMNRKRDGVLISAAMGNATTGPYDSLSTAALPAEQKLIPSDITTPTTLSVELLTQTWEMIKANEVSDSEPLYFVTNAQGMRQLLNEQKVGSADYNNVRALVNGEIDTYMGFKFLRSEQILSTTNAGAGNYNFHRNFAFARSGLTEGVWQNLNIRVDERADKNYTWQVYATMTCGGVRNEDAMVVEVDTTFATAN